MPYYNQASDEKRSEQCQTDTRYSPHQKSIRTKWLFVGLIRICDAAL